MVRLPCRSHFRTSVGPARDPEWEEEERVEGGGRGFAVYNTTFSGVVSSGSRPSSRPTVDEGAQRGGVETTCIRPIVSRTLDPSDMDTSRPWRTSTRPTF